MAADLAGKAGRTAGLDHLWTTSPDRMAAKLTGGEFQRFPHIRYLSRHVTACVVNGKGRFIVSMPRQEGKSWLLWWLAVWFLWWTAGRGRILYASYSDELAVRAGRNVQRIIVEHGQTLGVSLARDASRVDAWETTEGGGMWCAGVGGTMTGLSGDLILFDDPIKNWEAAQSPVEKERAWNYYAVVLRPTASENATIGVVQTRWAIDDPAGRLELASRIGEGEHFDLVRLPALAEPSEAEPDPLGREAGEPLSPLHSLESLEGARSVLTRMQWAGMYQQRPTVTEGDLFKRTDWRYADQLPAVPVVTPSMARRGVLLVRQWDLAATKKERGKDPDWTVGVLLALDETAVIGYVVDVVRFREGPARKREIIVATAEADAARFGGVDRVQIRGEMEGGSSGVDAAEQYLDDLSGYPVKWERSTGAKEVRAEPWLAAQQNGRAILLRRDSDAGFVRPSWWDPFVDEHADFGSPGAHDDQVDAASAGWAALTELARARRKRKSSMTSTAGRQLLGAPSGAALAR